MKHQVTVLTNIGFREGFFWHDRGIQKIYTINLASSAT